VFGLVALGGPIVVAACVGDFPPFVAPNGTETGLPPPDVAADAPALRVDWAKSFGGTGEATRAYGMFVSATGTSFLAVSSDSSSLSFGGAPLPAPGGSDAYFARLDADGNHLESVSFGDPDEQYAYAVTVERSNPFGAVLMKGRVAFGDAGTAEAGQTYNAAVLRFGTGLTPNALRFAGGNEFTSAHIRRLAPSPNDGVIAIGDWTNRLDLAGATFTRDPNRGVFVAQLVPTAPPERAAVFGQGCLDCVGATVVKTTTGSVIVGGSITGTFDFGDAGTVSPAQRDGFFGKLRADLVPVWLRTFGGQSNKEVAEIAPIPGSGDFVVGGSFGGELTTADGVVKTTNGKNDVFVARYTDEGTRIWLETFGGVEDDEIVGVAVDGAGQIVLLVRFQSPTIEFGGGSLTNANRTATPTGDIALVWLDAAGRHLFSTRFGSEAEDFPIAVGVDAENAVYLTGHFHGPLDLAGHRLVPVGDPDVFLAKLRR
jgi:hypothetical protein